MRIEAFGTSKIGRKRDENQDAMLIDRKLGLFVVCDGMGGHQAGRAAADIAVSTIHESVSAALQKSADLASGTASHHELLEVASKAIDEACLEIYRKATSDFQYYGMGCTATVLLISGQKAAMTHVGDTSLYLCRDEETERLNIPHTYAGEMIRAGALTPEAAEGSRFSHVLSRAVGTHETVVSDRLILDILPGDTFLLCSDGVTRYLEGDSELTSYLEDNGVPQIPGQIVGLADTRGGHDDMTAVVIRAAATGSESQRLGKLKTAVRAQVRSVRLASLFRGLTLANALRISAFSRERICREGEVLAKQGTPLASIVLVVSGSLVLLEAGREVRKVSPFDAAGIRALFGAAESRYLVRASERTVVVEIDAAHLLDLARRRPWFGVEMLTRAGALVCR